MVIQTTENRVVQVDKRALTESVNWTMHIDFANLRTRPFLECAHEKTNPLSL